MVSLKKGGETEKERKVRMRKGGKERDRKKGRKRKGWREGRGRGEVVVNCPLLTGLNSQNELIV